MPIFYIVDRQVCEVTWRYEVEAKNEKDAREKFAEGDYEPEDDEPEIGDTIRALDLQVEEVDEE